MSTKQLPLLLLRCPLAHLQYTWFRIFGDVSPLWPLHSSLYLWQGIHACMQAVLIFECDWVQTICRNNLAYRPIQCAMRVKWVYCLNEHLLKVPVFSWSVCAMRSDAHGWQQAFILLSYVQLDYTALNRSASAYRTELVLMLRACSTMSIWSVEIEIKTEINAGFPTRFQTGFLISCTVASRVHRKYSRARFMTCRFQISIIESISGTSSARAADEI
jgi:hypothetical protein